VTKSTAYGRGLVVGVYAVDMTQSENPSEVLRQRLVAFRNQLTLDGYACELVGGKVILNSAEGNFDQFTPFTLIVAVTKLGKANKTPSSSPTDHDEA
jgi:hypothetical protein